MEQVMLKTRIKNTSGQGMLFRWIAPRGQYLQADEEVIVEGAYPTAVQNRRFVSSCEYDFLNDRVELELVTNIPCRKPTKAEKSSEPVKTQPAPAPVPEGMDEGKVELTDQKPVEGAAGKPDERWQQGTIEGSKPAMKTLPGHEETLADAEAMEKAGATDENGEPKTLEIFPEGTDLGEGKKAEDEAAQKAAAEPEAPAEPEASDEAPANENGTDPAEPEAPADPSADEPPEEKKEEAPKKAPAKRKTTSRKAPRKTAKK